MAEGMPRNTTDITIWQLYTMENIGGKNGCKRTKTDDLDPVLLRCRHFFETLPLAVSRSDQLIHITTIYFHLLRFKPDLTAISPFSTNYYKLTPFYYKLLRISSSYYNGTAVKSWVSDL